MGQPLEGLARLVLPDQDLHPGIGRQVSQEREQRPPEGGGKPGHPDHPDRFGVGIEVVTGCLHGGQDGGGMVRQATSRRGEPDPASVRLDQRRADVTPEGGDLLRNRGSGDLHGVGDLAHRAQPLELHQ